MHKRKDLLRWTVLGVIALGTLGVVLPQDDLPENILSGGIQIPKNETPTYYCVQGFFSFPANVHIENDTLDALLDKIGIPTSSGTLKTYVIQLAARTRARASTYASLRQYANDEVTWKDEQYRLLRNEVSQFKTAYDEFLDACADESLDADSVHEQIVGIGRATIQITMTGEMDTRQKEALRLFEPQGSNNPWLE